MSAVSLFGHYIRRQMLLLATFEYLALVGSLYAGALIRFGGDIRAAEDTIGSLLPRALFVAAIMQLSLAAMGLYQSDQRDGVVGLFVRIGTAFFVSALAIAVCVYIFPSVYIGRGVLGLATAVAFITIGMLRAVGATRSGEQFLKLRVLVLGTGVHANAILSLRRRSDWRDFDLVGFVPIDGEDCMVAKHRIVAVHQPLVDFATEQEIDQIVVASDDRRKHLPLAELLECKLRSIEILDVVTFFEREFGKIRLDLLRPSDLIFAKGFQTNGLYQYTKRSFDVVMCLLLLAVTWPIIVLTAIAIAAESGFRAPIFYKQPRVGLHGKVFDIIKFRSMRVDAEDNQQARWAETQDSRITRVGGIIRKLRIDELPQVLNVLRGDMSFVGPRPERPEFVRELEKRLPLYKDRHLVKAGISGWAQLRYPYGASEKDALEKLQYDLYYAKNTSIFLDVLIVVETLGVVLFGKGAR